MTASGVHAEVPHEDRASDATPPCPADEGATPLGPGVVVAVLGAGVMGAGITRVFARAGHPVRVFDPVPGAAARIAGDAIVAAADVAGAVADAALVIEAAPEDLAVKHALFGEIERANAGAVIATNTSSLDVDALARGLTEPERLVIMHFFNPADTVPLVEVVPGPVTPAATVDAVAALLAAAGKAPVRLARAVPGFVANRLQAALYREAMALVDEGIATPSDVDRCVTEGLGPRWALAGPFAIMDLGGLDVWRRVCDELFPTLDAAGEAPASLRRRQEHDELGAKSGRGFFGYDDDPRPGFGAALAALIAARDAVSHARQGGTSEA